MNRQKVYEALFKTLEDALDWGYESGTQYVWYAGGVIDFATELLGKCDEKDPVKVHCYDSLPKLTTNPCCDEGGSYDYQ